MSLMAKSVRRTRKPLSDAEREERRRAERELLADAVGQLKSTDGWARWLRVRRVFHGYSLNNQLLIAWQAPNATRVTGFKAWLKTGRCVRKGEKAIRIFAPCPPNKAALMKWRAEGADPAERPRTFFRLASVFDLAQVHELPPPAEVLDLAFPFSCELFGEELAPLLEPDAPLTELAAELGAVLSFVAREGGGSAAGWYRSRTREICVYTDAPANAQACTAVHELGHLLVDVDRLPEDPALDYAREELVVESVAYSVLASLGIDAGQSAVPYLASWSEQAPIEVIEQHARLIDRLARRIETAIDEKDGSREEVAS